MTATTTHDLHDEHELSALGDALEAAAGSLSEARSNASANARVAARKVKSGIGTGAYYTAYGLSYGVVFSAVFLKELLPAENALRRGFEEGSEAAIDAVHARKARRAASRSRHEDDALGEGDVETEHHEGGYADENAAVEPVSPVSRPRHRTVKLKQA